MNFRSEIPDFLMPRPRSLSIAQVKVWLHPKVEKTAKPRSEKKLFLSVWQENTRSIYRAFLKIMAGGGGTIFSARTQIFSFWPVLDHLDHFLWWMIWTALTLPGSGTSSALGVPEGRPKIQVVCSFLLIFDQFWVLRAKKLRKMTKMFVFQLTLLKKYT